MHPVSCTNNHHYVTELVNQGMNKIEKLDCPQNGI